MGLFPVASLVQFDVAAGSVPDLRVLLIAFLAAGVGASLGSFASAALADYANGVKNARGRSVCEQCGRVLSWRELIPGVSYFLLRGKCAKCGCKIPLAHPLTELACAVWAVCVVLVDGLRAQSPVLICLGVGLIAAAVFDAFTKRLPDAITLGSLAYAPLLIFIGPGLTFADVLLGWALGGGVTLALYYVFLRLKGRECLGRGDIKLFALAGALCGWRALPTLMIIAATAGIAAILVLVLLGKVRDARAYELPFGPFIVFGILAVLLGARF